MISAHRRFTYDNNGTQVFLCNYWDSITDNLCDNEVVNINNMFCDTHSRLWGTIGDENPTTAVIHGPFGNQLFGMLNTTPAPTGDYLQ